jgi:endonuclease/exonuclease/phosphatase family metal-dependent hydrolase
MIGFLGGDFNLIRHPKNRNKLGGDITEMSMLNELILDLDHVQIPFSGRNFTWSNMQSDPLLVKLDWVLTSSSCTLSYPATFLQPLSKPLSDHIPYVLHIGSSIPKSKIFIFENY